MVDNINAHLQFSHESEAYRYNAPDDVGAISNVVVSCPHAGIFVPDETIGDLAVSIEELRARGDRYTDWLVSDAAHLNMASVISKVAPSYLNVGRALTSLNPHDVRGGLSSLSFKVDKYVEDGLGQGLVAVKTLYGQNHIYKEGKEPDEEEIAKRIKRFYDPFHQNLYDVVSCVSDLRGKAFVFDIHSCPSVGTDIDPDTGRVRPDLVFSNADGQSCDHHYIATVCDLAKMWGYNVAVNDPYKGGYVTQKYGRHAANPSGIRTQSMQVEFSRGAMGIDEKTLAITDAVRFQSLQRFTGAMLRCLN